jgi:hypothetical protein
VKTILGVGAGGGHVVQDEGMPLAARANLNFVGLGVAATDDVVNDATVVTIDKNYLYIDQAGGTGDTFGVLAGARDGNNVEFTVSQAAYVSGTLSVYLNGQLLTQGSSEDWHEAVPASGTFHFTAAPEATDEITVAYGYLGINPGGGDVLGPATNHDNYIPQWNGINSKTLKDGMPIVTSIGTPGLDTNIPTEKAVRDAIPTTMAVVREAIFTFEGTLLVVSGKVRIYNKLGTTMTISQVFIAVNTAPAGAAVIVDVHKNGITIFTDQIHRPQIADGQNTGFTTTIDIATLADGDYLTTDIDQIGNASDTLTVHVVYN